MEDENQHSNSDSDRDTNSDSNSNDNNSNGYQEKRDPVYYSDYEDYKKTEWTAYNYCSDSSADESVSKNSTSQENETERQRIAPNLPRLFGYSPALFCRFGGKVMCVPETIEDSCKWKKDGKCQRCYGPAQPNFEKCKSECFRDRGDVSHNQLGHFIHCSFRQRKQEPR